MVFQVRPWLEGGVALAALLMAGLMLLLVPAHPEVGLPVGAVCAGVGGLSAWSAWRASAMVQILLEMAQVRIWRAGTGWREVSSGAVRAVRVERSPKPPLPTTVVLLVAGHPPVPLMRFSLWGRGVLGRAGVLAQQLRVPLLDPQGEAMRRSRLPLLWWMAAGDVWAVLLVLFMVFGGPLVLLALWTGGRGA